MVDWYIYAKDWSGSTWNCDSYHENGLKNYHKFQEYVDSIQTPKKVAYLHWDAECKEVDKKVIVRDYKSKSGNGGNTLPHTIAEWIKSHVKLVDNIKLLYIITDGLIDEHSVQICALENKDIMYEKVVFYAFNPDQELDLSVVASFLTAQCEIYNNNELYMGNVDVSQDYDYDSINIDNFFTDDGELSKLRSYIRLKFILNAGDDKSLKEIEKLKDLRRRLFLEAEFTKKSKNQLYSKDKTVLLNDLKSAEFYKNLTSPGILNLPTEIDKSITALISFINTKKKSFSFNVLKVSQQYDQNKMETEEIDEDITFPPHEIIEFADIILLEGKGVPVILLAKMNIIESIIFKNVSKSDDASKSNFSNFKRLMSCPLFFLLDNELNESIEYFYTFDAYKKLISSFTSIGPHTRKPFVGGLVLSKEFDAYNDYIIAATYFNSNKVRYNRGLFYYVLYKICESKEWMDLNVLAKLKQYVFRRIEETICPLALTSLPLDPQENVSLTTALWYCVELSSHLFMEDAKLFNHERIRMVHPVVDYIIEILQYFEYDLNTELIRKRAEIFKNLGTFKRIFPKKERVYHILKRIFARDSNGFLIAKIDHYENIPLLNYLKLDHQQMIKNDDVTGNVDLNEYVYLTYQFREHLNVELSKETMRPYFVVGDHSFYFEVVNSSVELKINETNNEIYSEKYSKINFTKILSLNHLYISYVIDKNQYPSLEEYTAYVHEIKKFKNSFIRVFPLNVPNEIQKHFELYQQFVETLKVDEFIKKATGSVTRNERIKMEKHNFFSTDDEIQQFISNEDGVFIKK